MDVARLLEERGWRLVSLKYLDVSIHRTASGSIGCRVSIPCSVLGGARSVKRLIFEKDGRVLILLVPETSAEKMVEEEVVPA